MSPADSGSPSRVRSALETGQTLTLHLGVIDQLYRSWVLNKKGTRRVKGSPLPITTGEVAEILEGKYGLFSAFAKWQQPFIMKELEKSLAGAVESLIMGHAVDPWGSATQKIESQFRDFINTGMAERIGLPGVPTQAALHGVSHRYRHPYAQHPRRPSFRDTGLLAASFRSWIS